MTTFEDDVDAWVLAAVLAGPTSFDDLIVHLPGVYPTDVRAALDRLRTRAVIDDRQFERALRRQPTPPLPPSASVLPVPHPLDFDWRFTAAGVDAIAAALERSGPVGEVVCVGAPSVHESLTDKRGTSSTLLDANAEVIAAAARFGAKRSVRVRIGHDRLPGIVGEAVVLDPPWYPEHVRLFLWAAAQLCTDDGTVLLSFPPAGTRPGMAEEREHALAFAGEIGLSLVEIRRGELAYRSPPFERLALLAMGYSDLPEDWRRGDLVVFQAEPGRPVVPQPEPVTDDADWLCVPADATRIKARRPKSRAVRDPVSPRLRPVIEGDVLPSVSRRDPRRADVAVWTACNRVFGCDDVVALVAIAEAHSRNADPAEAVAGVIEREPTPTENAEIQAALEQLRELLILETRDLEACRWNGRRP